MQVNPGRVEIISEPISKLSSGKNPNGYCRGFPSDVALYIIHIRLTFDAGLRQQLFTINGG
jgi:hypothetical protein